MTEVIIPVVPSAFLERLPGIMTHRDLGTLRSVISLGPGILAHYWTSETLGDGREGLLKVRVAIEAISEGSRGYVEVVAYEDRESKTPVIIAEIEIPDNLHNHLQEDSHTPNRKEEAATPYIDQEPIDQEAEVGGDLQVSLLAPSSRLDAQVFFDSMEARPDYLAAFLDEVSVHCPVSCN